MDIEGGQGLPRGRAMTRILIWVRPASSEDSLAWDPWRRRWVVACRAPPARGAANDAVAALVAGWLHVPPRSVHWERAGSSRAKVLEVDDLPEAEVERRLRAAAGGRADPPGRPRVDR